jgi:hypothetical protein
VSRRQAGQALQDLDLVRQGRDLRLLVLGLEGEPVPPGVDVLHHVDVPEGPGPDQPHDVVPAEDDFADDVAFFLLDHQSYIITPRAGHCGRALGRVVVHVWAQLYWARVQVLPEDPVEGRCVRVAEFVSRDNCGDPALVHQAVPDPLLPALSVEPEVHPRLAATQGPSNSPLLAENGKQVTAQPPLLAEQLLLLLYRQLSLKILSAQLIFEQGRAVQGQCGGQCLGGHACGHAQDGQGDQLGRVLEVQGGGGGGGGLLVDGAVEGQPLPLQVAAEGGRDQRRVLLLSLLGAEQQPAAAAQEGVCVCVLGEPHRCVEQVGLGPAHEREVGDGPLEQVELVPDQADGLVEGGLLGVVDALQVEVHHERAPFHIINSHAAAGASCASSRPAGPPP